MIWTWSPSHALAVWARPWPQKPKLCTVRLGVGYSPEASLLRVNVMDVADLAGKEESSPDLYIKMFLVPDPKKATKASKPDDMRPPRSEPVFTLTVIVRVQRPGARYGRGARVAQRKTHVSTGTLTPHYDELFEWKVAANDLATKSLVVSLCEEGTLSNDILGEVNKRHELEPAGREDLSVGSPRRAAVRG